MTDPVALWVTGASCGLLVGIFIGTIGGEWWNAKISREVEGEKLDRHQATGEAFCRFSTGPEVELCGLSITSPFTHEVTKYSCGDQECTTCYPMTREQANEINQRFLQERGYGAPGQADDEPQDMKVKP